MQQPLATRPAVGVIFNTALSQVDDALAMALLYGFDGKRDLRFVSVSVSRASLRAAAYCDAVGRFYAGAVSGAIGFNGRTLPVGLSGGGKLKEDLPFFTEPLARKTPDGKPLYASEIREVEDTAETAALIRNALTSQWDENAIVVLSGPATDLANLLDVGGAKDLIARKVKLLVVAGGSFPDGEPEHNIKADIAAAKKLFAQWPSPIVVSGREVGQGLLFPGASVEKDFAWTPSHPVADAYRAHRPMSYDAPTQAMTAVLYAARPQEGYFKLSEPGSVSVTDDGRTRFTLGASGRQRYLILDPAQKERVVKTYAEVASAKPVERAPRVPGAKPQQQQKK